ncbi:TetR/AcrR family transcriptional regulator [Nocardia sp. NPDC050717]|uniref:TetR/AcrR family transcriptional regulator n=1 Tax=Nocardia sp. NPDC050717 TaxID=3157221 RepID=UPI003410C385
MSTSVRTAGCDPQRGRLLTAARTAFSAYGYHATTMDTVCAVAEVTKPVLYRHFPTKSALYRAVVLNYLDGLGHRLREAADTATADADRVRGTVEILFDLVESGPHSTPDLVFGSTAVGDHAVEADIAAARAGFMTALAAHLHPRDSSPARSRLRAAGLVGATLAAASEWHRLGRPLARTSALDTLAGWYRSGEPTANCPRRLALRR